MKYIAFADLHAHLFKDFAEPNEEYINSRLANIVNATKDIFRIAKDEGRTVLFAGDLFHNRGAVRSEVFNAIFKVFAENTSVDVIMIRGNHDASNNSINSPSSIEPFGLLPNVHLITTMETFDYHGDTITGVSYGEEFPEIKKFIKDNPADIMIAHLGIEGAKGAGVSTLDGAFTAGDLYPNKNGIIIMGHYHRSQFFTDNMLYLGNPVAQNFSDSGMTKGAWKFDVEGHEVSNLEFIDLEYPTFETKTISEMDTLDKNAFIRLKATKEEVREVEAKTTVPANVRLDIEYEATSDTRLNISTADSPENISASWADEFMPDKKALILEQINKVI